MLAELFQNQKRYLDHFFETLDVREVETVFQTLMGVKGAVVFTGVGKSGRIAEKIAATFVSTGTRSFFLSPLDALHGDIGNVTQEDVLIVLSKSGESEELLDISRHLKKKGVFQVGVVSKKNSRLEALCDATVHLPLERELCPYDLAPTTSTAIQLVFGDVLAIALMQAKQFSPHDFALNHPAGLLGKKATLRVRDLMLKGDEIPTCRKKDRLLDVLHELSSKKCGALLIVDENALLGVFTDGDLRRSLEKEGAKALEREVGHFMTKSPKVTDPSLLVTESLKMMKHALISILPVIEEGKVVGILRMHDILQMGF